MSKQSKVASPRSAERLQLSKSGTANGAIAPTSIRIHLQVLLLLRAPRFPRLKILQSFLLACFLGALIPSANIAMPVKKD